MKKQDAKPGGKAAPKSDDLYLAEGEIEDMRREFRADLEKMEQASREAEDRRKKGLD